MRNVLILRIGIFVLFVSVAVYSHALGATDQSPTLLAKNQPHAEVPRSESATKLQVLTYNVQFRNTAADLFAPRWPNTKQRAHAIGRTVACYDLVALQEVFRADRRAQLVQAVQQAGTQCGKSSRFAATAPFTVVLGPQVQPLMTSLPLIALERVAKGLYNLAATVVSPGVSPTPLADSGLLLLSRYPVREVNRYTFRNRAGFDAWAEKGVLHAVVCRDTTSKTEACLDVFVTHLQAGEMQTTERLGQVRELGEFIRTVRAAAPRRPALIMGDFNIDGSPKEWIPLQSPYSVVRAALTTVEPTLIDLWPYHNGLTPGYTNRRRHKRIDYIFMTEQQGLTSHTVQVNEFRTPSALPTGHDSLAAEKVVIRTPASQHLPFLSDHAGVEAELVWTSYPLPGTAQVWHRNQDWSSARLSESVQQQ